MENNYGAEAGKIPGMRSLDVKKFLDELFNRYVVDTGNDNYVYVEVNETKVLQEICDYALTVEEVAIMSFIAGKWKQKINP